MHEIACFRTLEALVRPLIRLDVEELWAVALSSKLTPIAVELIFRGDASGCQIHPREIFRFALRHGAVFLAIAHSHPSGDAEPSEDDLEVTQRLALCGRLIGIPLVDHLVISANGSVSLAERGHFKTWMKKRSWRF